MDVKILRMLIYAFSGLLAVFALLILINYAGRLSGSRAELAARKASGGQLSGPETLARQAMAEAGAGGAATASMIPSQRQGLPLAAVKSEGAIMVVKEKNFNGVAEPPKDIMGMLNDMGGKDRKKPAPIALKESDLDRKIKNLGGVPADETRLKASVMPEMGRGTGQEGITLLSAPVDFKIFKSSETWWTFTNSRKFLSASEAGSGLKPAPSLLSSPDFSKDSVVVLVSVSELPNGIFKIVKIDRAGKALRLDYRVDPLAMVAGEDGQHDFYSAAVIPRSAALKLRQVP